MVIQASQRLVSSSQNHQTDVDFSRQTYDAPKDWIPIRSLHRHAGATINPLELAMDY